MKFKWEDCREPKGAKAKRRKAFERLEYILECLNDLRQERELREQQAHTYLVSRLHELEKSKDILTRSWHTSGSKSGE